MRNPERIYKFCDRLSEIWMENCPDWRFTQLFSNVSCGRDLFYMEEEEFLQELERFFNLEHEE